MASYGIGQIISNLGNSFTGNNNYLNKISTNCQSYLVSGEYDSKSYKDYYIKPNSGTSQPFYFKSNETYYLKIHTSRNTLFDLNLNIKLVSQAQNGNIDLTNNYQVVRKVIIPQAGNGSVSNTEIILFQNPFDSGERILVKKVYEVTSNNKIPVYIEAYGVVKQNEEYYCLKNATNSNTGFTPPSSTSNTIKKINHGKNLILAHTWEQSSSDQYFDIEIVFSPRIDNAFNTVFLQLERTQLDDDLYVESNNGKEVYGLTLGGMEQNDSVELYSLTNLVSVEDQSSFSTIGVWGPLGLIMGINGEEVRIGSNHYYELSDFDIKSLGIVAKDTKDSFSVDYQFRID